MNTRGGAMSILLETEGVVYCRTANFREFREIREIRENILHANFLLLTVPFCQFLNFSNRSSRTRDIFSFLPLPLTPTPTPFQYTDKHPKERGT